MYWQKDTLRHIVSERILLIWSQTCRLNVELGEYIDHNLMGLPIVYERDRCIVQHPAIHGDFMFVALTVFYKDMIHRCSKAIIDLNLAPVCGDVGLDLQAVS